MPEVRNVGDDTTAMMAKYDDGPKHDGPKLVRAEATEAEPMSLFSASFSAHDMADFRSRWKNLQTGFVDEPRRTVEGADKLVAAVLQRLAEGFANERSGLEKQWSHGDHVSTEDLRVAFRRYRSFFDRLLEL